MFEYEFIFFRLDSGLGVCQLICMVSGDLIVKVVHRVFGSKQAKSRTIGLLCYGFAMKCKHGVCTVIIELGGLMNFIT